MLICKNAAVICNCRIFNFFESVLFIVVLVFVLVIVLIVVLIVVLVIVVLILVFVLFVFKLIFVSVIHFYHPVLLCAER